MVNASSCSVVHVSMKSKLVAGNGPFVDDALVEHGYIPLVESRLSHHGILGFSHHQLATPSESLDSVCRNGAGQGKPHSRRQEVVKNTSSYI